MHASRLVHCEQHDCTRSTRMKLLHDMMYSSGIHAHRQWNTQLYIHVSWIQICSKKLKSQSLGSLVLPVSTQHNHRCLFHPCLLCLGTVSCMYTYPTVTVYPTVHAGDMCAMKHSQSSCGSYRQKHCRIGVDVENMTWTR